MTRWHSPIAEDLIVGTETPFGAVITTNTAAQSADYISRTHCKWPYKDTFLVDNTTVEALLRQAWRSARLQHLSNLRKFINEN